MANFSPNITGPGQTITGYVGGPRHSTPNAFVANTSMPSAAGSIPSVQNQVLAGPHVRLFNPLGVQMVHSAPPVTGVHWGAGVMPVGSQIPLAIPTPQSYITPGSIQQLQMQTNSQILEHGVQSEGPGSHGEEGTKHEHRHRHRHKHSSHRDDKHKERKHRHRREKSHSGHSEEQDERRKHRSRHKRDKHSEDKDSNSSHHHRRKTHSRHKDRGDRHRGAVLIEDRDDVEIETGVHGAVLVEDRDPSPLSERGSRGALLIEDRGEPRSERSTRGAILLDDRDDRTSDRGSHGAILRDDRDDSFRGSHGAVLIEDRDESRVERGVTGAVLLEDCDDLGEEGEITSELDYEDGEIYDDDPVDTYSDGRLSREDRRERQSYDQYDRRNDRGHSDVNRGRKHYSMEERRRYRQDSEFLGEKRMNGRYRVQADRLRDSRSPEWRDERIRQNNDRGNKRSDRNVSVSRHTGALLIEDHDEGVKQSREHVRSGRQGAILIEDRDTMEVTHNRRQGRQGAILIEDRDDSGRMKRDRVRGGRQGALLLEDGLKCEAGRVSQKTLDDSRESRAILLDDRDEPGPKDYDERRGRKGHHSDRESVAKDQFSDRKPELEREKGNRGPSLSSKRGEISTRNDRNCPDGVESEMGRTGAILIEDKRDQKREISRSGAVLIEDRVESKPLNRNRSGFKPSFNNDGQRGQYRGDRTSSTRSSQDVSRNSSVSRQEMRGKRSRGSSEREEPDVKKKRVWEPAPNDVSVTKCIRSLSPVLGVDDDDLDRDPIAAWVRCSAADLYFTKDPKTGNMVTTKRMRDLEERVDKELVQRAAHVKAHQEPYERPPVRPHWKHRCTKHSHHCGDSDSDHESPSSSSSSSDSDSDSEDLWMEELKFKQQNPYRLSTEIWYNEPCELNYGPLCRCSIKAKQFGIRHSIYPGEKPLPLCDPTSNNLDKLYHYRVTVSPAKNFIISRPTVIMFDGHEYLFEGFSIFSHSPIPKLPECQVVRFNIIYTIHVVEEQVPENFSVQSLDTFAEYMFDEILELVDMDWRGPGGEGHCRRYHIMPRFARPFPENGKELLSMNDVLLYMLKASKPLLDPSELKDMYELDNENWTKYVDSFRHMVVTCPGKRPSSIRIDQLDRSECYGKGEMKMPFIIHHGVRPPQLSYAGDPTYKKKWREYMKFRHLLWSRARVTEMERQKLNELESELEKIRMKCTMKREITVAVSSEGFLKTGIRADICQHAMILPVLFEHLRFHECLSSLETTIGYHFNDRSLLQLAMTHSSYKINYGTNPDHGRNSLSNCGFRQLEFGDHKRLTQHTRKRGLNVLLRIMAKMGHKEEKRSEIPHNERLEFLGDAVVEFVTSTHLYNMFPQASEGELTLYRGCLVNNNQLSVFANNLRLQDYLLYAHGPDLCHDSHLKHAMANCFEALMGALFLDGGIEVSDRVFAKTCFTEPDLFDAWTNTPKHPLVADEPNGDRHWISQSHVLQKLCNFETDIGYEFKHIRLLARAFTQRNVGYNNLTFGHNQRLEFLGDTIMQLICSEYLFKHFPDHHEGHLTLLRSSLVNNKTQAIVASELGMPEYVINVNMTKIDDRLHNLFDLKTKEKADLLEALYGALYIDGGLEPCQILTDVCFFPRLEDFILDQEWNDPKSQLQQCCLTLREMNDESPDIPIYKVIGKYGPTNQRRYTVAVYFREKRLAVGTAGSKQQAEMVAADLALKNSNDLFNKNVYQATKLKVRQMVPVKEEPAEQS